MVVDSDLRIDPKIRQEQERFAATQTLVLGIEATSGDSRYAFVMTNLKKGSISRHGFSPYVLINVSPIGGNPYFYLQTYEKPVLDQKDEEIIAIIESNLAEEMDAPFFKVREGRLGMNEGEVSELSGHGKLGGGSASAIEVTLEVINQRLSAS